MLGIKIHLKIQRLLCKCSTAGLIVLQKPPPKPQFQFPANSSDRMSAPKSKPNFITACNLGQSGEKEFVVACRGRPFSILTAPQFPTPTVTYVDYGLICDLHLKISDLQCTKLSYGGEKLRILGKISTSVQCIFDGSPSGNMHFKAHVVEDLKLKFNMHSIAGTKLSNKLLGPPFQLILDDPTEPTENDSDVHQAKKKKRKHKAHLKTSPTSGKSSSSAQSESPPPTFSSDEDLPKLPTPPRSRNQGEWTQHYGYQGWHPIHGHGRPDVLRCYYEYRPTRRVQNEVPDSWDSDGTFHSLNSMERSNHNSDSSDADEYADEYANISSVRYNNPARRGSDLHHAVTKSTSNHGNITKSETVLSMHGATKCSMMCEDRMRYPNIPEECGYNPAIVSADFLPCSIRCPGRWCLCFKQKRNR